MGEGGMVFPGRKNRLCEGPLRHLGRKDHVFLRNRQVYLESRRRKLEKLGMECCSEHFIWVNSIITTIP